MNGAGEIRAWCNDDFATARFNALTDRASESRGAIGATIAFRAKLVEIEAAVWKTRWFDAFEDRRHHRFPRAGVRENCPRRYRDCCAGKQKVFDEIASRRHLGLIGPIGPIRPIGPILFCQAG